MRISNREKKRLSAAMHNEAYLESKKPKPPAQIKPVASKKARRNAQMHIGIGAILTAVASIQN